MKTKIVSIVTLTLTAFFMSCTNESVSETETQNAITTDEVVVDSEIDASVDDVAIIAEDQFDLQKSIDSKSMTASKTSTGGVKSILPACATVSSVLENGVWTRTIDFGTQGCTLLNGNIVKGKMSISFSKNYSNKIKTITYKLEGFYHNGNSIEGNKTITYEIKTSDLLAELHPVTTHSIDLTITSPEGKVYVRKGDRVREMVEGFNTFANWDDNVFKVWGSHSTVFPNGSIQVHTTLKGSPLLIQMSCKMPFPVSGLVTIEKKNQKATLDYGNGDCDRFATITIDGVAKEITLKK